LSPRDQINDNRPWVQVQARILLVSVKLFSKTPTTSKFRGLFLITKEKKNVRDIIIIIIIINDDNDEKEEEKGDDDEDEEEEKSQLTCQKSQLQLHKPVL
jgi:hypothetical protein